MKYRFDLAVAWKGRSKEELTTKSQLQFLTDQR